MSFGDGAADYLLENRQTSAVSYSNLVTDGRLAVARTSAANTPVAVLLLEGGYVDLAGTRYVEIEVPSGASASLSAQGEIAAMSGEGITNARIYAPAADTLLVNDEPVVFSRDGDFIVYDAL